MYNYTKDQVTRSSC